MTLEFKAAAPGEVAAAALAAAVAAVVFVVCFMALALYHAHRPGAFAGETFVAARDGALFIR